MTKNGEVWVDVEDYPGYKISSLGRVMSFMRSPSGRILKLKPHPKGYMYTRLYNESGSRGFKVHRLVASHFIGNPLGKPQVNHINHDKADNSVENLEWATQSENMIHSISVTGSLHYASMFGRTGVKSPYSKEVKQYNLDGTLIHTHVGLRELCRKMGWNHQNINISMRNGGTAYGYRWGY